jgi:hypothetical protein
VRGVNCLTEAVRAHKVSELLRKRGSAALDEHDVLRLAAAAHAAQAVRAEREADTLGRKADSLEASDDFQAAHDARRQAQDLLVSAQAQRRKADAMAVRI